MPETPLAKQTFHDAMLGDTGAPAMATISQQLAMSRGAGSGMGNLAGAAWLAPAAGRLRFGRMGR
jgi:hypothetical protein